MKIFHATARRDEIDLTMREEESTYAGRDTGEFSYCNECVTAVRLWAARRWRRQEKVENQGLGKIDELQAKLQSLRDCVLNTRRGCNLKSDTLS